MRRHDLLRHLHEQLRPRTYFEIGVDRGRSMALSRVPSIGVDPAFTLDQGLHCDLHLVRETSDEFFARPDPMAHFGGRPIDLAFVDGMHLAEYALRDVVNVERHAHAATVLVVDDMLPRTVLEAARDRVGSGVRGAWTGDVFKLARVLREARPDLVVLDVDTVPTGVMVVLNLDAGSAALGEAYDAALPDLLAPDPQVVPDRVLHRTDAVDPDTLATSPVWARLRQVRDGGGSRADVAGVLADAGWR